VKFYYNLITLAIIVTVCLFLLGTIPGENKNTNVQKTTSYEQEYIAMNQMKCNISNNFSGFNYNPFEGIYWPGGSNAGKGVVYMDQLLYSCIYKDSLVSTRIFGPQFYPGRILDTGTPDDPNKQEYRVYRIKKGWESMVPGPERDRLEKDYNDWPVDQGAPWEDRDGDGVFTRGVDIPKYMGDQTLWYVMNDVGPDTGVYHYRTTSTRIGLEIQVTTYGFDRVDDLGDVVFRDYKIINKSGAALNDFFLGYFGDLEIGAAYDDRCGTDTTHDLVYGYNSTNFDPVFGEGPPAVGTMLLRGPIVPGASSDSAFFNERWIKGYKNNNTESTVCTFNGGDFDTVYEHYHFRDPQSKEEVYNVLQGKIFNGLPVFDPFTGQTTKFCLPGDPINHTGWYYDEQGWPGLDSITFSQNDIRMAATYGHFNLAPYDTQEIVIATLAAQGNSNLNSITELERKAKAVKYLFNHNFQTANIIQSPEVNAYPQKDKVTLWWKDNSENYAEFNPLLGGLGYSDTLYRFQGYIVKQYRDEKKTDPRLVKVFDIPDTISVISGYVIVNGEKVKVPLIGGNNEGLQRYIDITTDAYTGEPLSNANPYYFSVDAYAVSLLSIPAFIESDSPVITVLPGRNKIDFSSPYENGGGVYAQQTEGSSNADVFFRVIDPTKITGDEYLVSFSGQYDSLKYNLINTTTGDTVFKDEKDFSADTLHKKVFDGMMLIINDKGRGQIDSLAPNFRPYGVKRIIETRGPGGIPLDNPVDVYENFNSTGKWKITSIGNVIQNIDVYNYIDRYDYELRFTQEGSEYYPYGFPVSNFLFGNNPKATDRVPFEIWNVTKGKRINIKIQDIGVKDNKWSKDTSKNQWERIYAYNTGSDYTEPIPEVCDSSDKNNYPFGNFTIEGDLPEEGTVIRIETFKPIGDGDQFTASPQKADFNNTESAKYKIDKISVFPNPYFGGNDLERSLGERIVRFTGLPKEVTIRIYTLAGVFVRRIDKSDLSQYIDWDLKNDTGNLVASGIYIAHLDMPGIGTKILKIAVVIGKEFLNRN
jgi:hypothetical protein